MANPLSVAGDFFRGLDDVVWMAPGIVFDMIGGESVDSDRRFLEQLGERTNVRFRDAIGDFFGPETGVGALVGAVPEGVRDSTRGIVQGVTEGIETAGREWIREPIATGLLATSLADTEQYGSGFLGIGGLFNSRTWRAANTMAQDISVGQSLALMIGTRDILDPGEVERTMNSSWFDVVSGTADAAAQIFLDPTVLGAKATLPLRTGLSARMLARADNAFVNPNSLNVRALSILDNQILRGNTNLAARVEAAGGRHAAAAIRELQDQAKRNRTAYLYGPTVRDLPSDAPDEWVRALASEGPIRSRVRQWTGATFTNHNDLIEQAVSEAGVEVAATMARSIQADLDGIDDLIRQANDELNANPNRTSLEGRIADLNRRREIVDARGAVSPEQARAQVDELGEQLRIATEALENTKIEQALLDNEFRQGGGTITDYRTRRARLRENEARITQRATQIRDQMHAVNDFYSSYQIQTRQAAARRIATALFDEQDPYRFTVAEALAGAPDAAARRDIMAFYLGDGDAIRRLDDRVTSLRTNLDEMGEQARQVQTRAEGEVWPMRARTLAEEVDALAATRNELQRSFENRAVTRVFTNDHADAINRFDLLNDSPNLTLASHELDHMRRELGLFERLIPAATSGTAPQTGVRQAFYRGLDDGLGVTQTTALYTSSGSRPATIAYDVGRMLTEWNVPILRNVRDKTLEVRGRTIVSGQAARGLIGGRYARMHRPPNRVDLEDQSAEFALQSSLAAAGMDDTAISIWGRRLSEATGAQKVEVWEAAQDAAFRDLLDRYDLGDFAEDWIAQIRENETTARAHLANTYAVRREGGRMHAEDSGAGDISYHVVNEPVALTQAANTGFVLDFLAIDRQARRMRRRAARGLSAEEIARGALVERMRDQAVNALDVMQGFWKVNVLLRPAWATRVVYGDEILRQAAEFGLSVGMMSDILVNTGRLIGAGNRTIADRVGLTDRQYLGLSTGSAALVGGILAGVPGAAILGGGALAGNALMRNFGRLRNSTMRELAQWPGGDPLDSATERGRRLTSDVSSGESSMQFVEDMRRDSNRLVLEQRQRGPQVPIHPNPQPDAPPGTVRIRQEEHLSAWAQAVNGQLGSDRGIQQLLRNGGDVEAYLRWLMNTTDGRAYAEALPIARQDNFRTFTWDGKRGQFSGEPRFRVDPEDLEDFARVQMEVIDNYLGWDKIERDPRLLDNLFDRTEDGSLGEFTGGLTAARLAELYPDVNARPVVHGADIDRARGLDKVQRQVMNSIGTAFDLFATLPSDIMSRQPTFQRFYLREMRRRIVARGWGDYVDEAGQTVTGLRAVEAYMRDPQFRRAFETERRAAEQWALSQTRSLMYDLASKSQFHHLIRFIMPFAPAMQEVAQRWLGLAWHNPDRVAQLYAAWDAFSDNLVEVEYASGETEKMIRFRVPDWLPDPVGLFGGGSRIMSFDSDDPNVATRTYQFSSGNLQTNPISGGLESLFQFGVGPMLEIPLAAVANNHPSTAEALDMFFPFGVPQGQIGDLITEAFTPAWVRTFSEAWEDSDRFAATQLSIMQTLLTRHALGEAPEWMADLDLTDPNDVAEIRERVRVEAQGMHFLYAAAGSTLPTTPRLLNPYQFYMDAWRDTMDEVGDFSLAQAEFYDRFGDEFYALLTGLWDDSSNIPLSMEGFENAERFAEQGNRYPEVARFIYGDTSLDTQGAPYSQAVAEFLANQVDPATGEPLRERKTTQEFYTDSRADIGWRAYQRTMDHVTAEVAARGITLTSAQDAAIKRAVREQVAAEYPEWEQEYSTFDPNAHARMIEQFRGWLGEARELGVWRPQEQAVADYLELRDGFAQILAAREESSGARTMTAAANEEVREAYLAVIATLKERDPVFASVFDRYFDRDIDEISAAEVMPA